MKPERSVVRIVNYTQRGNYFTPWDFSAVSASSGSGFVIDGGLVMTNAHVVSDSRLLLIFGHDNADPWEAEVVHVAHDCDLALIRPVEPSALAGVPTLEFGSSPALRSTVDSLGYPTGGTQVSSTRGVISRIEEQFYVHSGVDLHLTVQTDAAINPGSSGGPVLQGHKVVGVAFQANPDLQSVGFFIPMEVVGRFLRDVRDGRYDGYPELGAETAGMHNPAARSRLGLEAGESGVRVFDIMPGSSADGRVRPGDVLLRADGREIDNDGYVVDGDSRIPFGLLVDRRQIGESVSLRVLRDGGRIDLDVPLTGYTASDFHRHLYDREPRYFVYGGLVFVPLNLEIMKTFGSEWYRNAERTLLHEYLIRPRHEPEMVTRERVVLLRRLSHPVNAEMSWYRNQVVERVNGKEIHGLRDLVETIEQHRGEHHLFEFSNLRRIGVLDRREADAATAEILATYGIERDRRL